MSRIGEERREIYVEPLQLPEPLRAPDEAPAPARETDTPTPELVPTT